MLQEEYNLEDQAFIQQYKLQALSPQANSSTAQQELNINDRDFASELNAQLFSDDLTSQEKEIGINDFDFEDLVDLDLSPDQLQPDAAHSELLNAQLRSNNPSIENQNRARRFVCL